MEKQMDETRDLRLRVFALETALAAILRASASSDDELRSSLERFLDSMSAQARYWESLLSNGTPEQGLMALDMSLDLKALANGITQALDRFQDAPPP